ncbi:MAG TPA: septum formation initiator family protein [Pseudonocardiaceae bacterium]|jgi:cell division protein FtsB|nr:septum formation initiator family protein [Pseudonocardiaceae bacterium]
MGDPGPRRVGAPGGSAATRPLGVRIGHFLGITSPRRAAILAAVVCGLALSVAVPLRNYVGQRSELAAVHEQQQILTDKVAELQRRRTLLEDTQHIQAQARERLRYVRPGEAPYLVQLPPGAIAAAGTGNAEVARQLWYAELWKSINSG